MSGRKTNYNVSYHFCQQFIDTGACDAGYYCRYAHPIHESDRLALRDSTASRKLDICQRHMAGKRIERDGVVTFVEGCRFGSDCRYSHCEVRINPSGIASMLASATKNYNDLSAQTGQVLRQ